MSQGSSKNTSRLSNINAHKVAGRDINETQFTITGGSAMFESLYVELSQQIANDDSSSKKIEELERFLATPEDQVVGLVKKLTDAGFTPEELDYPEEAKEQYYKSLEKFQFFEAAQHVHANLLDEVHRLFKTFIVPKLGLVDRYQIMELVEEKIVKQVQTKLGTNKMNILPSQVVGMVYYLTGKCFLEWVKKK